MFKEQMKKISYSKLEEIISKPNDYEKESVDAAVQEKEERDIFKVKLQFLSNENLLELKNESDTGKSEIIFNELKARELLTNSNSNFNFKSILIFLLNCISIISLIILLWFLTTDFNNVIKMGVGLSIIFECVILASIAEILKTLKKT